MHHPGDVVQALQAQPHAFHGVTLVLQEEGQKHQCGLLLWALHATPFHCSTLPTATCSAPHASHALDQTICNQHPQLMKSTSPGSSEIPLAMAHNCAQEVASPARSPACTPLALVQPAGTHPFPALAAHTWQAASRRTHHFRPVLEA
eukprot:scaffold225438_cov19-Tisochrysis_lutea.AAC.1